MTISSSGRLARFSAVVGWLLYWAIGADSARAVIVSTSTYAQQSVASGVSPNPASAAETKSNLTTISSSIKSDVSKAHATAYASAKVTSSGVVKSNSGTSVYTAGAPSFDPRSAIWSSTASGTTLIARTIGAGGPTVVPMQITFPLPGDPAIDTGFPTDGSFQADFGGASPPTQGVLRDNAGLAAGTLPSSLSNLVLKVTVKLDQQPIVTNQTLFDGTATFSPDGKVAFTNSFFSTPGIGFQTVTDTANPNALRTILTGLPTINFQVLPDRNFDLTFDMTMNVGDPLAPTSFAFGNLPRNLGLAGAFTVRSGLVDTAHFSLDAVVPEPSSLVLLGLGSAAFGGLALWRHNRS